MLAARDAWQWVPVGACAGLGAVVFTTWNVLVGEGGWRSLARPYLGAELGDRYIESTRDIVGTVLVRMRPE